MMVENLLDYVFMKDTTDNVTILVIALEGLKKNIKTVMRKTLLPNSKTPTVRIDELL